MIGDLLGPGITEHIDVLAGDLGQMVPLNENGEFAIIFGDSFRGKEIGAGGMVKSRRGGSKSG
ncbi:hypothetical protein CIP102550_01881 [Corynebacterium diphtheriae]|nr:hypothetical protein CIP102550_01881 [Corynebacterium diphtheriae]